MGKEQKIQDGGGGRSQSLGREFSAGGVVFRRGLWLVCKSNPTPDYPEDYWRLPKGWIDDEDGGLRPGPVSSGQKKATEEDLRLTALREVREEGGVEARIIQKIGTAKYFIKSRSVMKFVTYYLMKWVRDLPEGFGFETEKVEWLPFKEARKRLNHAEEKKVLKQAATILAKSS